MVNLDKYKSILFEKIKNQLTEWFEMNPSNEVDQEEVNRFLHSLKGTSGTLQLGGLEQIASQLMLVAENREVSWKVEELRDFLYELIGLSYEYEHFHEIEEKPTINRDESLPLIQVIDDDVSMLILLKDALEEQGWMVITNTEPTKATKNYFDMHPDCLIVDINLPTKSGFELLQELQSHNSKKFIPTIVISIENNRNSRIKAYQLGADDFIKKPIDIEEFIVRVNRHLRRKQLFDQSVLIDELTQVYNRKFLEDSFNRSTNELKRLNTYFTIAVLDLDFFKKVNDTYGHIAGDRVLASFAQFLNDSTRSSDTVFRYGGEEFIILFPRTRDYEAKEVLTRLIEKFSKIEFKENGQSFFVTFSAGVFMVLDGNIDLKSAIKTADQALYMAKENGRARVESANSLQHGMKKKVLNVSVIDDDAIIRTMLMKILKSMEFDHIELDIEVFEDGLKYFESKRNDKKGQHFLILDGVMPVMDGIEVLQKVKQSKNANQYHILMLTGRKSDQDIASALKLGADDYVTKPFSITELQARINLLINRMK
ncbi:diguanylate cyclase [Bacillus sp. 31A1R]|uniref:Diguanylate cyclase n=1 Tax=Robertmurraya mangrovi TaxID=3098077 RepID=A0ABU5J3J8_9BACI|nr:diguanylate cyclase [Bacillus sp. 31A1R]MDZ5473979.1 diguanylate cyclase [Bacillus sp. 31A1R]